jgi:serine/threonine-protein kinase
MSPEIEKFDAWNKQIWHQTLAKAFPAAIPTSASWTDLDAMVAILTPFCPPNVNHTHLPGGGGQDIIKVAPGREPSTLDLYDAPSCAFICRPATLTLEHFPDSVWNSFFLLETAPLQPSGVYEGHPRPYEELLELPDGEYLERSCLDAGHIGHDESGDEIPIPDPHRLVTRFFSGKFLMVAKASLWNHDSATYDGRHNQMTPAAIRTVIAAAIHTSPPGS